jgi:hypothetical protein
MATLFFEGFDRGIFLKELDDTYWSTDHNLLPFIFPKYAFGANTYSESVLSQNTSAGYVSSYQTYSPNNGILPIWNYGFGSANQFTGVYPGFGQVPGFIALTNIPLDDNNNLQPISSLQLSGFPVSTGDTTFFGIRCLGIETKHEDYWSISEPQGRYDNRHPFLAFCSGANTGLLLSFIKVSGSYLTPLRDRSANGEGPRFTIGLQVEQTGEIKGVFDLNVSSLNAAGPVDNYRITPYYCNLASSVSHIPSGLSDENYKVLTIATTDTSNYNAAVINRWTHFEFGIGIDNISLKIEGADSTVINTELLRSEWSNILPIDLFKYDNIKIFNRTYMPTQICAADTSKGVARYGSGSVILFDDITLVDDQGSDPRYFLGHDCKVLPLLPGFATGLSYFFNNMRILSSGPDAYLPDGPLGWNLIGNLSGVRRSLATIDGDSSAISSDVSKSINVVRYSNINTYITDSSSNSLWRISYNDAIGGIKVYNNARKTFLDTGFKNVCLSQNRADFADNTMLLLHYEDLPFVDSSQYANSLSTYGNISLQNQSKYGTGCAGLDNGFLNIGSSYDVGSGAFTIESWIKFDNNEDEMILFDRIYDPSKTTDPISFYSGDPLGYRISCTTGYIEIYQTYNTQDCFYYSNIPCATGASVRLYFNSGASTGVWNHVALTRTNYSTTGLSGYFTVYLNGQSGFLYQRINVPTGLSCGGYGSFDSTTFECPGYSDLSPNSGRFDVFFVNIMDESNFTAQHISIFGNLESKYKPLSTTQGFQTLPITYIGGTGNIDELRVVSGISVYSTNFTPPSAQFIGSLDEYIEFGPTHQLNRTSYKKFEFFQMLDPSTNQPWNSNQISSSGLLLGVKKL